MSRDWEAYFLERRAKEGRSFTLKGSLSSFLSKEDGSGKTIGDDLLEAYAKDRLEHPERISLKELSAALGESKQSIDVTSDGEPLDFFAPPKGDE